MNPKFKIILDKILAEIELAEKEVRAKLIEEYAKLLNCFQVHHAINTQTETKAVS